MYFRKLSSYYLFALLGSLALLAGCSSLINSGTNALLQSNTVYVASNKADENTVVAFKYNPILGLQKTAEYGTQGKGTGDLEIPALKKDDTHPLANGDDPLISAYGILITDDKQHLLSVNAGDASISLMKINVDGSLTFVNKQPASDKFPVSVAEANGHVVVASVGNTNAQGSIAAYTINNGQLTTVANSRRDLMARPSTVAFSSNGQFVLLTELVTGKIKAFKIANNGNLSSEPVSTIDSPRSNERFHAIPVGFDVAATQNGDIIAVSEARFLTPDFKLREEANVVPQSPKYSWQTGGLSTYRLSNTGELSLISGDVMTGSDVEGGEIANCWVEFSNDGKTLYAANALSSSISLFNVSATQASLATLKAYKEPTQMEFLSDMKINPAGSILFQLVGNQGKVLALKVNQDGSLTKIGESGGLPILGSYGLEIL